MNSMIGAQPSSETDELKARGSRGREAMWGVKLVVCILYDLFDMTIGRVLFVAPFSGEIIGCLICASMFGWSGVLYGLEAIDPTEQLDGFIPVATIIALANRPGGAPLQA